MSADARRRLDGLGGLGGAEDRVPCPVPGAPSCARAVPVGLSSPFGFIFDLKRSVGDLHRPQTCRSACGPIVRSVPISRLGDTKHGLSQPSGPMGRAAVRLVSSRGALQLVPILPQIWSPRLAGRGKEGRTDPPFCQPHLEIEPSSHRGPLPLPTRIVKDWLGLPWKNEDRKKKNPKKTDRT